MSPQTRDNADADIRGRGFDLVANRALVFLALTACGVVTYAVLVSVIGTAVPARGANAVLVGSALAAVLLLTRDWMQRGVDWLLYGDRHDPQRAILRVGRDVESAPDPGGLLAALTRTVAAALRLSYLEVEITDPATVVRIGEPTTRVTSQPLLHSGSQVGRLRAGRRGERLSRQDLRLLDGVAPQLAAAAETLRLRDRLAGARDRIVRAREEERRRLRRDLHDVLGPALAGIGLGLDAARARARREPAGVDELLQQLRTEVADCVGELRRIIEGLRPPTLDERGLVGALHHHVEVIRERQPGADVELTADGLGALPAAIEVVAYLIAQEALTNALRHAGAGRIGISVRRQDDTLLLEVVDDGAGLGDRDADGPGVGLASMAARAEEIGGRLELETAVRSTTPGAVRRFGTTVRAVLPLQPMAGEARHHANEADGSEP